MISVYKRLRLLPVLMIATGVALTARVGDLWQGFAVMAQEKPLGVAGLPGPAWDATPAAGDESGRGGEEPPAEEAEAGATSAGVFKLPPDPLTMTDEEIDLLQALAERRQELEQRARRVEEREVLLQAAERRIEEKVDGLKALQQSIEILLKQHEEETESQYNSLVKIYENMKPKDAARIFEELDMEVLLPVVERMKERKTAPILAKMNSEKAKAITTELAQRRALPTAQ
jgi:flagellar motility protein MotE (MotC chaperone)